ncbi:hypothetical protein HIM_11708 [Hirsutella minnesotensis 3608]|uniref:UBL3-like ubiquitin domain-containing protein n=1 Tax=Hirsutella minnesotensis 3608 TaxID=1043627 RepID=A0A0F7ZFC5_9HYPO|nr:hypothetical protein HIM_11708 [Hirsutella minnesotensis 3608]
MESTMSGGNSNPSGDSPRLERPSDAILVEYMLQSPEPHKDSTKAAPGTDGSQDAAALSVTFNGVANDSEWPAKSTDDLSTPSKGMGKEEDAPAQPSKQRRDSIAAIGLAQDDVRATAPDATDGGPVCNITLLLSSGSRHPYNIDARNPTLRNVVMPDETEAGHADPFSISVYTLKELLLREWRNDWEAKPASPSSIRLIRFGKLLEDKEQLNKYQLSTENPNVVHMSIRPSDLDEDEPKTRNKRLPAGSRDGQRTRSDGNCCVIL